jgi:tetratricopeptide (TPR) repeat protein
VTHLVALESEPYTDARRQEFAELAAQRPDDGLVQFGNAWLAGQGDDLPAAEAAYRRTLEVWPGDARATNNLGHVLARQKRYPEAIETFRQAAAADSSDAVSLFNLSRALTHEFDFDEANLARSRAAAIDFDLVREHPETGESREPLFVDRWIAPSTMWQAVRTAPATTGDLPGIPADGIESWPGFGFAVAVVAVLGLLLGHGLNRRLPIGRCRNCRSVLCRRCAQRRNAEALCPGCARVDAGAPSPAFAAVLLEKERVRRVRFREFAERLVAFMVPGAGLLGHQRVVRALSLLFVAVLAVFAAVGTLPYAGHPRLGFGAGGGRIAFLLLLVPVYALSLLGYFAERDKARERREQRLRPAPTRRPALRLRDSHDEAMQEAA